MRESVTRWRTFAVQAMVLGVVVFVATRAARAWEGTSGGAPRSFLTVAGTLAGVDRTRGQSAQFTFESARGFSCGPIAVTIPPASPGSESFSVEVPIDGCRGDLFDGASVTARAQVGGLTVSTPVNPVPYARYAEQYGTPDCPVGYRRVEESGFPAAGRLCQRFSASGALADVVVRVGDGPSAFWIDRYEASVWSDADGSRATTLSDGRTVPWGEGTRQDDFPPSFPKNGQWTAPLYAVSRPNVAPTVFLTWFQGAAACRSSGKRLPTGEEWLAAARGTRDPGASDGSGGTCITMGGAQYTPSGVRCASAWGAQDMIGNVRELTGEWYAGLGDTSPSALAPWSTLAGEGFPADATENIASSAYRGSSSTPIAGLPAVGIRGGGFSDRETAGVLHLHLRRAPSAYAVDLGFRCVIPR